MGSSNQINIWGRAYEGKVDPTAPATWLIKNQNQAGWMSKLGVTNGTCNEWVLFDFAAPVDLDKIDIWNYYQANVKRRRERHRSLEVRTLREL